MRTHRDAWNKGRLPGQKPPLKPKEIWSIRIRLQLANRARDLALYARIVKGWIARAGLDPARYGTHSPRRTKATLIYKRTK